VPLGRQVVYTDAVSARRRPGTTRRAIASVRVGAASGLVLASGLTVPATVQGREWELRGDGGVFVAFHFGGPSGIDVGWGLEAHGVYVDVTHDCDGAQQLFSGLVARLEVLDFKRSRLTAGPVVGRGNGGWGFAGEVTGGLALGKDAGPIIHLSAEGAGLFLLNARVGYTVMRDWQAGVGLRFPPINRTIVCTTGRPLRSAGGRAPVQGAQAARPPGAPPEPLNARRVEASSVWMRRACFEWASVPAFCALAEELKVCGAPPALVAQARQAAVEELGHAIASAEVAASLGGMACVSLDPPVVEARPAVSGSEGLRRLARESWEDGSVGEGTAALLAAREAAVARDPAIGRVQALIAAQESGHAELAWKVIDWALAVDRAAVEPLLVRSAAGGPRPNQTGTAPASGADLGAFGILPANAADRLQDQVLAQARARLAERLVHSRG
jgi:hypothetical protein